MPVHCQVGEGRLVTNNYATASDKGTRHAHARKSQVASASACIAHADADAAATRHTPHATYMPHATDGLALTLTPDADDHDIYHIRHGTATTTNTTTTTHHTHHKSAIRMAAQNTETGTETKPKRF
jgi:hypothetical protein